MPPYEDVVRPFQMAAHLEYTDVWTFPSVRPYKGKHPAEKPHEMLAHIIGASSYEGDIILDCFSGSGSTAVAALTLNRCAISIDIEQQWFDRTVSRVETTESVSPTTSLEAARSNRKKRAIESLFD